MSNNPVERFPYVEVVLNDKLLKVDPALGPISAACIYMVYYVRFVSTTASDSFAQRSLGHSRPPLCQCSTSLGKVQRRLACRRPHFSTVRGPGWPLSRKDSYRGLVCLERLRKQRRSFRVS